MVTIIDSLVPEDPNETGEQVAKQITKIGDHIELQQKKNYVNRQKQTRNHSCHWPGCDRQVPPAMWGCKMHWMKLPKYLRDKVWNAYEPGQEIDGTPSTAYLVVVREVMRWIRANYKTEEDS